MSTVADAAGIAEKLDPRTKEILISFAKGNFSGALLEVFVCGIQVFMIWQGYMAFRASPKDIRRTRRLYMSIAFTILFLSILAAVADNIDTSQILLRQKSLIEYKLEGYYKNYPWYLKISELASFFIIIIADALLVYRCYLIWCNIWIMVLPVLAYAASVATGIICIIADFQPIDSDKFLWAVPFQTAFTALSGSTNILLTSLIVYRLLRARSSASRVLVHHDRQMYAGAIAIVIESAIPFAIVGILRMILILSGTNPAPGGQGFIACLTYIWPIFGALSPQLIIYRVGTGQSWVKSEASMGEKMSQPIAFVQDRRRGPDSFESSKDLEAAEL